MQAAPNPTSTGDEDSSDCSCRGALAENVEDEVPMALFFSFLLNRYKFLVGLLELFFGLPVSICYFLFKMPFECIVLTLIIVGILKLPKQQRVFHQVLYTVFFLGIYRFLLAPEDEIFFKRLSVEHTQPRYWTKYTWKFNAEVLKVLLYELFAVVRSEIFSFHQFFGSLQYLTRLLTKLVYCLLWTLDLCSCLIIHLFF